MRLSAGDKVLGWPVRLPFEPSVAMQRLRSQGSRFAMRHNSNLSASLRRGESYGSFASLAAVSLYHLWLCDSEATAQLYSMHIRRCGNVRRFTTTNPIALAGVRDRAALLSGPNSLPRRDRSKERHRVKKRDGEIWRMLFDFSI